MKGYTHTKGFRVLIGTVVALLIVIIFTSAAGGSFLSNILGAITTPMLRASASTTETVFSFTDLDSYSKEELKERVAQLEKENLELRSQLVEYAQTKKENEGLRGQLKIQEENPDIEMCAAAVISRDPNDMFYNFSIDKGYLVGVQVGDTVISDKGLVGVVSEAYATTSKVTTILSPDNKVAVYAPLLEDESGVLDSDILTASIGNLRLNYLKNDTAMQEGTLICTSGVSGLYPKDINVGYVTSVHQSSMDISKIAAVKPYEDIKTVQEVYVITGFPGKNGQDTDSSGNAAGKDAEDT